jgi:hypothetical protein
MDAKQIQDPGAKVKRTTRLPAKARGVFEGDGVWWICWACPPGHLHREKIGPKALALTEYQKRKVAVKTAGFWLTVEIITGVVADFLGLPAVRAVWVILGTDVNALSVPDPAIRCSRLGCYSQQNARNKTQKNAGPSHHRLLFALATRAVTLRPRARRSLGPRSRLVRRTGGRPPSVRATCGGGR